MYDGLAATVADEAADLAAAAAALAPMVVHGADESFATNAPMASLTSAQNIAALAAACTVAPEPAGMVGTDMANTATHSVEQAFRNK